MTPEQETDLLNRVGEIIRGLSVESRARLAELLASGMAPHKAVMRVAGDFSQAWATELALGMSALHAAEIPLSAVLAMPVSGVKLSKHLYANSRETAATVSALVKQHLATMKDARKLALELYEGYGFRQDETLKVGSKKVLPRYLLNALNSDPAWNQAISMADSLKTPALKAAYMQALEAVGKQKLERMLDVAYQEKMRYFAKRIAVTELHREWDMIQESEYLERDDLEYVQWRMSQTHERSDICDLYARQDKYGLGPGCYPKALAPRAPAHPFCRCVKAPRLDLTGAKVRHKPGADRAYLRSLPVDEAARVAGSREKLLAALKGDDVGEPEFQRVLLKSAKPDTPP